MCEALGVTNDRPGGLRGLRDDVYRRPLETALERLGVCFSRPEAAQAALVEITVDILNAALEADSVR